MNTLHVFTTGDDWVIAENQEDAVKVWDEHCNDEWFFYGDLEDWKQLPDDQPLAIAWEDIPPAASIPPGIEIEQVSDYHWRTVAYCGQWVEKCGRSFLCSVNF